MVFTCADILALVVWIIVILVIWGAACYFYVKTLKSLKKHRIKDISNVKQGLAIGLASSFIVVIVDRTITILFASFSPIQFNNLESVLISLTNTLIQIAIAVGIIFFGISLIMYRIFEKNNKH